MACTLLRNANGILVNTRQTTDANASHAGQPSLQAQYHARQQQQTKHTVLPRSLGVPRCDRQQGRPGLGRLFGKVRERGRCLQARFALSMGPTAPLIDWLSCKTGGGLEAGDSSRIGGSSWTEDGSAVAMSGNSLGRAYVPPPHCQQARLAQRPRGQGRPGVPARRCSRCGLALLWAALARQHGQIPLVDSWLFDSPSTANVASFSLAVKCTGTTLSVGSCQRTLVSKY